MLPKEILERESRYLRYLLDAGQIETKVLELKLALPAMNREGRIEFLADTSSLVNTTGGELIFGISQNKETGRIEAIPGISVENIDQEIQRLENMLRDGLKPRILSKEIFPIPWEDDKLVILIRLPKSMIGPHRVTFDGHDKFYGRNANGKYPLDVDELRIAFNHSQNVADKIRSFHIERLLNIVGNETFLPLEDAPRRILHLIPAGSFSSYAQYDLSYFYRHQLELTSLGSPPFNVQYNLDGIISFFIPGPERKCFSYLQLYRNGVIEAVREEAVVEGSFAINAFERDMAQNAHGPGDLKYLLALLQKLNIPPYFYFFLAFSGLNGYKVPPSRYEFDRGTIHTMNRPVLDLPELLIDRFDINPGRILRTHFDLVWNAWGYPNSPNYDKEGNWELQR